MKKTTIEKALRGIDYSLPICVDKDKTISIALPDSQITEDSLVFFTERLTKTSVQKVTFKGSKPYAVVINSNQKIIDCPVPIIRVKSVRRAFSYSCSNIHELDFSKLKIIGITGTNGKTTTATMVYNILKIAGYTVGFIGTGKICINDSVITDNTYSMTTPDPTYLYEALGRMQNENCEYVVMEVSSHSLALEKVSPIKFKYGIFTNLNNEHLDFHPNMDEYFKTKLSLFMQTERGLFNLDDPFSKKAYQQVNCKKSSFGIITQGDAYATDISCHNIGESFFYYREPKFTFSVKTKLTGAFNVYNAICALKCVIDLGIKPCIAKKAIESIDRIDGRMQFIRSDITAVIDYAHTPQAFYNLLKSLISSDIYKQNLTIVFGCGGERDKEKRAQIAEIASKHANKIIITEDNCRNEPFANIVSDIVRGMDFPEYKIVHDRESAIRSAILEASPGEIIAIVGKGHEKYKIERNLIIPFDEEAIINDALKARRTYGAY